METDQRVEVGMSTHLAKTKFEPETKASQQRASKNSYSSRHQRDNIKSVSKGRTTRQNVLSVSKKRGTGSDEYGTTEAESTRERSTISKTNVDNEDKGIRYPDSDLEGGKNISSTKVKYNNPHTKEHTSSEKIDTLKAQTGLLKEVTCLTKLQSKNKKSSIRNPHQSYELEERIEQIYATLYGQCIGDAIGLLTEFMSKSEADYYYDHKTELEYEDKIEDSHRERWKVGDWTDDSDQMILIMQSLTDKDGVVTPNDFARRLVPWRKHGFNELGDKCGMGIGHTTYNIISRKDFEQYPHKASKEVWEESGGYLAPNGGVMRTSILGIQDWWDLNKVYANAIDICKTTHFDSRCQASAVAVCTAISLMLQRGSRHFKPNGEYVVETIIEDAFGQASTCLQSKDEREPLWKCLQCEQLSELKLDENNAIGYTYKCLGAGFWALKQTNFRNALQEVVMSGGDADTNAAVAGALLGCKLGNRILFPATWLKLEHKGWLDKEIHKYLTVLKKRQEDWNRVFGKEQTPAKI